MWKQFKKGARKSHCWCTCLKLSTTSWMLHYSKSHWKCLTDSSSNAPKRAWWIKDVTFSTGLYSSQNNSYYNSTSTGNGASYLICNQLWHFILWRHRLRIITLSWSRLRFPSSPLISRASDSAENQQLTGREEGKKETPGLFGTGWNLSYENTAKDSVLSSFSKWEEFDSVSKWRKGGNRGNTVALQSWNWKN